MEKEFNVTGICIPGQHYMMDASAKFKSTMRLIESGKYFTINRPRQYGKTTMLFALTKALKQREDYVVFQISFEGIGDDIFKDEQVFCPGFLSMLASEAVLRGYPELEPLLLSLEKEVLSFKLLSIAITQLAEKAARKIVLLIDEVDKSSNNQLFISFVGMLRDMYLKRTDVPGFHSVVLTGVHDVRTLKTKLRPDEERKLNSPWNIAADFDVDMNFYPNEIKPMLEEYAQDRDVQLDVTAIAERLFYHTSGYPFLVSKLCKIFDEKILPGKAERSWTTDDVDAAARQLVQEDNPNFQELIKNLEHNPELHRVTKDLVVNERSYPFNFNEPTIHLGITYGIFVNRNGLDIHNRIYRELIEGYMAVSLLVRNQDSLKTEFPSAFELPGNQLDIKKVLLKFQEAMREEHHQDNGAFLEREGRLVFLAFLKPVLNGHGHAFKEPQISEEKRLDVVITYHEHRYVVELKVWRGPAAHLSGLDQLADYLDRLGLQEGSLLIFDQRKDKQWKQDTIEHKGKTIFAVWS